MLKFIVAFIISLLICEQCNGFHFSGRSVASASGRAMTMEYIPDGLTKAQWAAIKKKEEEEKKERGNQAIMGTKRFKSRSFEAWQKAGGVHLFPVDPTLVPYEERPYMQRRGGDWEGSDLKAKGIAGKGMGSPSQRLAVDGIYEKAKKEGKLDSASIFGGANLPWTNEAANKISDTSSPLLGRGKKAPAAVASKKLSPQEMERLKKSLVKPVMKQTKAKEATGDAAPKKKLFGLF